MLYTAPYIILIPVNGTFFKISISLSYMGAICKEKTNCLDKRCI